MIGFNFDIKKKLIAGAFFYLCIIAMVVGVSKPAYSSSFNFPQQFIVTGNRIVDEQGNETVLRGVASMDPVWQAFCDDPTVLPWKEEQFQQMSLWGIEIVRLPIHPASWRKFGEVQSFQIIDQAISWAQKYGMYILLDFHSIGFPPTEEYESLKDDCFSALGGEIYQTTKSEIEGFWQAVASRYKGNKLVAIYDIFNEPDHNEAVGNLTDWLLWRDYVENLIDIIRAIDPDKLVLVGGLQFGYDLSFVQANPVRKSNVIYGTHPYPSSDWFRSWDSAFGNLKTAYPVFASEFGFQNSSEWTESLCTGCPSRYRDDIIFYLEAKKISWAVWNYSDTWGPTLLNDKNYTPNTAGYFFKAKLIFAGGGPNIKANGSDGPVTIAQQENLTVTVALDANNLNGQNADWWFVENTPSGTWNYYDLSGDWLSGLIVTYQGALIDMSSYQVNVSGLSPGVHTFYFGVDTIRNGSLDSNQIYYDSVVVNVKATITREDGAYHVNISEIGSLQNPAWSPDGASILFTRFRNGYNKDPADLFIINVEDYTVKSLVSDGSGNINLPGSSWNAVNHKIVFTSTRDPHDEIFVIDEEGNPGDEVRITNREDKVAFEPSFSPDGKWVVFESHKLDVEGNGVVTKYKVDGTGSYQELTGPTEDNREPNWSPDGNLIVYQNFNNGQWDVWVMNTDGKDKRMVTSGPGDKTDASFSPDGQWIVYSSDEGGMEFANLFIIPVYGGNSLRVTNYNGYDGAPSWSPGGKKIAFESYPGDPDNSEGTTLLIIDVPDH